MKTSLVNVLLLAFLLLVVVPSDAGADGPAGRAEVSVTETPSRVTLENDVVRIVFDGNINYVPCQLIYKLGSGENLIVNNFCLYYQYVAAGEIRSVNEGYPGGTVTNGRHRVEQQQDGSAMIEFSGDTPHFRFTRRITLPPTGADVKFVYELEATTSDMFGFSLPYAPITEELDRLATWANLIGPDSKRSGRMRVEKVDSYRLPTGSPYDRTACYFHEPTGDGLVFAHVPEECVADISRCTTPKFVIGARERCTFVVTPFRGNPKEALASRIGSDGDTGSDASNASSAVVLKRTPQRVVWADHATRKIFPGEPVPTTASEAESFSIEAAPGEYEPFQIVLASQQDLADVKLVLPSLTNERGDELDARHLRYHPIGSLRSSYEEDIPDLLLQKDAVPCRQGQNCVFWVTVHVPRETPAGTYRGTIALMSQGKALGEVGLRLKVWDFALAPTPHICAFATDYVYYYDKPVDLNDEAAAKAQVYNSTGSEEEIEAYKTRMQFFADHRLYETHFGPRPNYAGAMRVRWQEQADGYYDFEEIDFRGFDKARQYCYEQLHWPRFAYDPELVPYLAFINQFTFGGKGGEAYWYMGYWDPVLPKKVPKKYQPSVYDLRDDFTPEFKEKLLRYIRTIAEHCREHRICIDEDGNGPVLFLADEIPDYASGHAVVKKTLELARMVKQADPKIVLVVNGRDVPDDPEILNLFDLWTARCPPEMLTRLRSMGKRYGDYYMHGYFNLRSTAISPRIQFWSYWKYDFFWIGSWAMTIAPDQRWYGSQRNYANSWWFPSMESRYGEPMSTIRFELMREGLEDHEYLWMLRDRVAEAKGETTTNVSPDLLAKAERVLDQAEAAGGNYTSAGGEYFFESYLEEPVKLLALRHEIAETLESLVRQLPPHASQGK